MKVNTAVCGRFHYHNYMRHFETAGVLERFYYSHKVGTNGKTLGIPDEKAMNLWLKEYLIHLHGRLTKGRFVTTVAPLYGGMWQKGVCRNWVSCDVLHLLVHGMCERIIARAKAEGATIVGEAVNQHPEEVEELLIEEADLLGLRTPAKSANTHRSQLKEVTECDYLISPSQLVKQSYIKRGVDEERTFVLPYGVDFDKFQSNYIPGALPATPSFRVICVAQITPRKGHIYLLEAWNRLKLPDAELLLIGALSADMEPILNRYIGKFRHIRRVPNETLRQYYSQSSVFVLPSIEDGFAVVCGEAMACGLPVITTENNGVSEILSNGIDGFVIPIRSWECLAERLELLYYDAELRMCMSTNARAKAKQDLSWQAYAARLIEFYRSILKTAGRGRTAAAVS